MATRRIGVLTSGGDASGMNAAVRAVVRTALDGGFEVFGIFEGFNGLIEGRDRVRQMSWNSVGGIIQRGGTVIGTARSERFRTREGRLAAARTLLESGIDNLVVIGGDGSLSIAYQLQEKGLPVVGIPKTIDNDLAATDVTFGFDSALATACEAVDKLHTTAASHHRLMVLEVMGRYAGWIALGAAMAGGAHMVLIPEIPFQIDKVAEAIRQRSYHGRQFAIVVVAEGAVPQGGGMFVDRQVEDSTDSIRLGGIGRWVAGELESRLEWEARATVLGHLQRGGAPTAYDRVLASRFGVAAANLVAQGEKGRMVCVHGIDIESVPLAEAVKMLRRVDPASQLVESARSLGISFGD